MANPNLAEQGIAYRWKPGERPPGAGRPSTAGIRQALAKTLAEANRKGGSNLDQVCATAVRQAIAGDVQWARLLLEYVYGKPVQQVDVDVRVEAESMARSHGLDPARVIAVYDQLEQAGK